MSAEERVRELAAAITPPDPAAEQAALARHDRLVKPPGSLGRLEEVGIRLAGIAGSCPPPVPREPAAVVAAGDHGVLAQGVSAWPAEVTGLMVAELCAGRAAANALAKTVGARLSVLDVGVACELRRHPLLRGARVRPGTADLSRGDAMTREEASRAVLAGAGVAEELIGAGVDLLVTGDMGIGNTTAAACLIAAFSGRPAGEVTGPGAGADAATLARKRGVVAAALARHEGSLAPDGRPGRDAAPAPPGTGRVAGSAAPAPDGLATLAALGGLEHAALAGVILAAARERVPVVLDGVSTVAAGLAARALCPSAARYAIAGHRSTEPGATAGLAELGLEPLLELGMRLGEGTGALLAVPIVRAAAAALAGMATFEEAGIRA